MVRAGWTLLAAVTAVCALASRASASTPHTASTPQQVTWQAAQPAPGIVDLAGPRSDGRLAAAVDSGLSLFGGNSLVPLTSSSGSGAYAPFSGEPYVAMTTKVRLPKSGCSFHRDEVFAIADAPDRLIRIDGRGRASNFVNLPSPFLSAIAFDRVGSFGHRLLVTGTANGQSTLYAVDCRGRVKTIASHAPLVEGGMEVAPRSFGRFGGRLIAVDEFSGLIWGFKPNGRAGTVAVSGLPAGGDIGVESIGFVPKLKPGGAAFLAGRNVNAILRLTSGELGAAQVRAGDLLVAAEANAETIVVRCQRGKGCAVRRIGVGPANAHAEGHIAFLGVRR
jgi:hypothetical protein